MTKTDDKDSAVVAYNSIVASAELADITLVSNTFLVKPEYYKFLKPMDGKESKIKRAFGCHIDGYSYDSDRQWLSGQFDWSVDATFARRKLLTIKSTYIVSYHNVPDVGEKHAQAFVRRVGRFATYPYFRALVSHLSWESGSDLPLLPVLK